MEDKAPLAVQQLFEMIGMTSKYKRFAPEVKCPECGQWVFHLNWHLKLGHDKWDVREFQKIMYDD